jgi:hypothetical protein
MSTAQAPSQGSQKLSSWPTVLGVVCACMGMLDGLGALSGLLAPAFVGGVAMDEALTVATTAAITKYRTEQIVSSLVGLGLALTVIVAGVKIFRRRRRGVLLGWIWAPGKLAFTVLAALLGHAIQTTQMAGMREALASRSGADARALALGTDIADAFGMLGIVLAVAWGWALPVVWMIWFRRAKVRAETRHWD